MEPDNIEKLFRDENIKSITTLITPQSDRKLVEFIVQVCRYLFSIKKNNKFIELLLQHYNCRMRSLTPLFPYQTKAVKYFDTHNELLLYFGTGTGKTLTALAISQCYLDKYPQNKIIVITPSRLKHNFALNMESYGGDLTNYFFYSFEEVVRLKYTLNAPLSCENSLLIIDEVHNLRNYKGLKFEAVMECAQQASKRLLLTATPIVNYPYDIITIIDLLYGKYIVGPKWNRNGSPPVNSKGIVPMIYKSTPQYEFKLSYSRDIEIRMDRYMEEFDKIIHLLRNSTIYVPKNPLDTHYPQFNLIYTIVNMTPEYAERYESLAGEYDADGCLDMSKVLDPNDKNLKAFYNIDRQIVNCIDGGREYYSKKLDGIIPIIGNKQTVIYTNWIEHGVEAISILLTEKLPYVKFGVINTTVASKNVVEEYNNKQIQILLLTRASSEGLDLKNTRNLIIIDPPWNPSSIDQIIGRTVRYNSHESLPPDERVVDVYLMMLKKEGVPDDKSWTGDMIVYRIIRQKQLMLQKIDLLFKKELKMEGEINTPLNTPLKIDRIVVGDKVRQPVFNMFKDEWDSLKRRLGNMTNVGFKTNINLLNNFINDNRFYLANHEEESKVVIADIKKLYSSHDFETTKTDKFIEESMMGKFNIAVNKFNELYKKDKSSAQFTTILDVLKNYVVFLKLHPIKNIAIHKRLVDFMKVYKIEMSDDYK